MIPVTDKVEFLSELPIFANLSDAGLELVASVAREYAFRRGSVIAYQRDVANKLFIVMEGRLFARALDDNGIARDTRSYTPGQYFLDTWLFVPDIHSATIKGADPGKLLIIDGAAFTRLLQANPGLVRELAPSTDEDGDPTGLSDGAWAEAQKLLLRPRKRANANTALLPDEHLEFFARRSYWVLLGYLILPTLIVLVAAAILIATPETTPIYRTVKITIPVLLVFIGLVMFGLRIIDWYEDYFIITNRHLTHHEFELRRFRIRLVKIPVSQIQTVEVLKPSLIANILNIGSAIVTTSAIADRVLFDNIDDPLAVKTILERLTRQYQSIESAQSQAVLRQAIERHFGAEPQLTPLDEDAAGPPRMRSQRRFGPFEAFHRRYGWRVVEGSTITYRKSFVILLRMILGPLAVFAFLTFLTGGMYYVQISTSVIAGVAGLLYLINFIWFIWQVENWRNDIFQVTDRFVIDIDRLPFGFGESRKQAAISNIQNIHATRPGFFPTLFNYGFVHIDTAGAQSDIVFEYVINPELIQSDIFQRLDDIKRIQRVQEGSQRREEYALLLDVYRQAMEQNRIPTRTPTETDIEEETEQV